MLAIARTLMTNPALLLLDEPLEGLAPIIVDELLAVLRKVIRNEGMSAIVVEQKARKILGFTDRAIILDRGRIVLRRRQRRARKRPRAARGPSRRDREQGAGCRRQMQ